MCEAVFTDVDMRVLPGTQGRLQRHPAYFELDDFHTNSLSPAASAANRDIVWTNIPNILAQQLLLPLPTRAYDITSRQHQQAAFPVADDYTHFVRHAHWLARRLSGERNLADTPYGDEPDDHSMAHHRDLDQVGTKGYLQVGDRCMCAAGCCRCAGSRPGRVLAPSLSAFLPSLFAHPVHRRVVSARPCETLSTRQTRGLSRPSCLTCGSAHVVPRPACGCSVGRTGGMPWTSLSPPFPRHPRRGTSWLTFCTSSQRSSSRLWPRVC